MYQKSANNHKTENSIALTSQNQGRQHEEAYHFPASVHSFKPSSKDNQLQFGIPNELKLCEEEDLP